jgi:hypothetical protein
MKFNMLRSFTFCIDACIILSFSLSVNAADAPLNCPAIAANTPEEFVSGCHNGPLSPLQSAICHYNPKIWGDNLLLLDSTLGVDYIRALRALWTTQP